MDEKILVTRPSMPSYEEYIEAIKPLWDSHWITNMGTYHRQLEKELKEYMEHLELIGEGGTDFRPAFEYVNHLIEQGEFYHLKGLIYFTDGKGTYPKKKPPYQTAFIFMQEEYEDVDVPPWAVKLIVDAEDLDEGEEEHEY